MARLDALAVGGLQIIVISHVADPSPFWTINRKSPTKISSTGVRILSEKIPLTWILTVQIIYLLTRYPRVSVIMADHDPTGLAVKIEKNG